MSTKRIDFVQTGEKKFVMQTNDSGRITNDEFGNQILEMKNWAVILGADKNISIHCSSKARNKRRDFNLHAREGSLFLYNSNTDWYWYFRNKSVQDVLDILKIDKINTIDTESVTVPIFALMDTEGHIIVSTDEDISTIKFYPMVPHTIQWINAIGGDTHQQYLSGEITFKCKEFLLTESNNHRSIFIKRGLSIKDLYRDGKILKSSKTIYPEKFIVKE